MKCNSGSKNIFLHELFQNHIDIKWEADLKLQVRSLPELNDTRSNYLIINPIYNKPLLITFKTVGNIEKAAIKV